MVRQDEFAGPVLPEGCFVAWQGRNPYSRTTKKSFRGTVCRFRRSGSLALVGQKLTGRTPKRCCGVRKGVSEGRRTPERRFGVQEESRQAKE